MRVSTARFYQTTIEAINRQQQKLVDVQQQLATGKRVLQPSDDPAAATRSLALEKIIEEYGQYARNTDFSESKLALEESAVGATEDILQRVRELAVAAASQLNTENERKVVANEVEQLLNQAVDISNYRDGANEYIFAGFQSKIKPFTRDNAGNVTYNGDQGQRELNLGPDIRVPVGDPGSTVFQAIRNGNGVFVAETNAANAGTAIIGEGSVAGTFAADTYTIAFTQALPTDPITYTITGVASGAVAAGTYATVEQLSNGDDLRASFSFNGVQIDVSGQPTDADSFDISPSQNQDMFTTIQNFIDALSIPGDEPPKKAAVSNGINRTLSDLNRAMDNLTGVRTQIGARRNTVQSQQSTNDDIKLELQSIQSGLVDLDFPQAVSVMNRELMSLQAAQTTFVRMQNLSIFNFLR